MRHMRYYLVGLLTAAAAGCGASHQPAPAPAPQTQGSASAKKSELEGLPVQVDNQNFSDMNIYVVSGGQRLLLGQAGGFTKTTLTIPSGIAPADGRLRLSADPIGGSPRIFTPVLVVSPGQTVFWTIGSDAEMSTASVG
jgi:hypothetical protein